jgi:uncharacterized protein YqjF (DUF2071 family)
MSIKEILNNTEHRPWNIPAGSWKFYQEWNNAIFLHWEVDINELKKFVPKELEIDLFNEKPIVSVVAFTMEKIRPKNLPPFSPISDFDEINIRTYVKFNNKSGVYFLSIEGSKYLSCKIAKQMSELPYRFSQMNRTKHNYKSYNSVFNDKFEVEYVIGREIKEKSSFDIWTTERYALFQDTEKSINEFEIHHLPWTVSEIDIQKLKLDYPRFKTLLSDSPHKVHYSKGVRVIAWDKIKHPRT